ncbi:MAG: HEAT repeat domain-containing protein [Anaerolineales bacterium]|nr:HEAT repeat domain-containing protein [Anaerolineales bacterium]
MYNLRSCCRVILTRIVRTTGCREVEDKNATLWLTTQYRKNEGQRDVKGRINVLGYEKDASVQQATAELLGQVRDARAVEPLIAALTDRDGDVRKAAAEVLVEFYKQPGLSSDLRQAILSKKQRISARNTDHRSDSCLDSSHLDEGIGVNFSF